jgi:hypothetical protein
MRQENKSALLHALSAHAGAVTVMMAQLGKQIDAEKAINEDDDLTEQEKSAIELLANKAIGKVDIDLYVSTDTEARRVFLSQDIEPDPNA